MLVHVYARRGGAGCRRTHSIVVQGRRPLSPTYLLASLTPGSAHCTAGNRMARGGTKLPKKPTRSPDAFRRRQRRRMGTGTA